MTAAPIKNQAIVRRLVVFVRLLKPLLTMVREEAVLIIVLPIMLLTIMEINQLMY